MIQAGVTVLKSSYITSTNCLGLSLYSVVFLDVSDRETRLKDVLACGKSSCSLFTMDTKVCSLMRCLWSCCSRSWSFLHTKVYFPSFTAL